MQPGETLCGLLGPGDFAAVGLVGAGVPTLNGDGTTEAYCVYAGKSSGTGGIEFDAFAGTTADAPGTYQTVVGEGRGGQDAASLLPGADAAAINLASDGGSAVIAVRAGKLVFAIGFPASDRAKSQLTTLAQLVLERAAAIR